jgi:hypothetical protein
MRKILATAAVTGIMALGLAAAPAQASTTAGTNSCEYLRIVHTDFDVVEVAAKGGARDRLADRADLWAIAGGRNGASPLLREAAEEMSRDYFFKRLDTADRPQAPADGRFSRNDLKAMMDKVYDCG